MKMCGIYEFESCGIIYPLTSALSLLYNSTNVTSQHFILLKNLYTTPNSYGTIVGV